MGPAAPVASNLLAKGGHPTAGAAAGTALGGAALTAGAIGGAKDKDGVMKTTLDNAGNLAASTANPASLAGKSNAANAIGSTLPTIGFANKAGEDAKDIKKAAPGDKLKTGMSKAPGEAANVSGNLFGGTIPSAGSLTGQIPAKAAQTIGATGGAGALGVNALTMLKDGKKKPGDVEAQNPTGGSNAPHRRRHLARRAFVSRQALERKAILNELMRRKVWATDKF